MYKVGDKFEIEIEEVYKSECPWKGAIDLYRIKGFNSLVFDENGLDKLKKIEPEVTPKTVKASELAVDTKVLCSNLINKAGCLRYFAGFFGGIPYTFINGGTSVDSEKTLVTWEHMTLEDGTVVVPE